MAWLKGLAGKAEDFLNQIDQNAAVVLTSSTENGENGDSALTEVTWDKQEPHTLPSPTSRTRPSEPSRLVASETSYPSKSSQISRPRSSNDISGMQSVRSSPNLSSFTPVLSSKPKNDDDLIEFLNRPPENSSPIVRKKIGSVPRPSQISVEPHEDVNGSTSRPRTPSTYFVENSNSPLPTEDIEEQISTGNYLESSKLPTHNSPEKEVPVTKNALLAQTVPSKETEDLRTENRLLQNELRSFNNEMSLLLQRSKAAEKECNILQQRVALLETTNNQYSQMLKDRDEQATHLEKELQQANQALSSALDHARCLQVEITNLKQDSVNSSGAQSEALLTCRQQLAEKGEALENIRSVHQQELLALKNTIHSLKSEKGNLSNQIEELQQRVDECRKGTNEWQEKFNKSHAEVVEIRTELDQYRVRAQRILQDKEKLISELRGEGFSRGSPVDDVTALELEQLRQERELVREEAIQVSTRLQATRAELSEAERRFETYKDQAAESQTRLQESLHEERKLRQAAEEDCRTHSEGLHSVREELSRQRGLLASKLREREAELTKLRSQLSQRPVSPMGDELESRLHALTQTLVQKQTSLETITTERNALRLQYEKMEMKHREAMALLYQHQGTINVNDTDDAKARVPSFLEESPFDTGVARRVKRAYSNLDAISIRTGVFLRRYPLARILVLCYMVLLHLWVMVVLFTYTPEVHPMSTKSSKGPHSSE